MRSLFLLLLFVATTALADRIIDCDEYARNAGAGRTGAILDTMAAGVGTTPHKFVLSGGAWTINTNRTFTNSISWYIAPGSSFTIATNVTLSIQGSVYSDANAAWHTGTGTNNHTGSWFYPDYASDYDTIVSNAVTAAFIAADTVVSNGVTSAFGAADTIVSNAVTAAFIAADTVVSNGLVVAYSAADTVVSNALNTSKEDALGNPATSGWLLSSTDAGVRSWIVPAGAGQTPWASDINAAGYSLTNVASVVGTNGVNQMSVPVFKVRKSGNQTITAATHTKVSWETTEFDIGSGVSLASNQWTCPYTGKYLFVVLLATTDTGATRRNWTSLYKNDSRIDTMNGSYTTGSDSGNSVTILNLVAGDVITVYVYSPGAITLSYAYVVDKTTPCFFSGFYIGQ